MVRPQKSVHTKKRGRGRPPTGRKYRETIPVRLTEEALTAVDGWIERQAEKPSRSEAIRRLVESGLKQKGHVAAADTGSDFDFLKDTTNEIIRCMVEPTNLSEHKATAIAKGILDHFKRKQKPAG